MSTQDLESDTNSTKIDQTLTPYMNNLTLNDSSAPSTGGWGWDQDETDEKSVENKIHNEISNENWGWGEENQKVEKEKEEEEEEECTFPVRNGQPDCAFYMKTGSCKYGSNCRYNHPANGTIIQVNYRNGQESFQPGNLNMNGASPVMYGQMNPENSYKEKKWGDHYEKNVQIDCKYYSTPGGCKYGSVCRYIHRDNNDTSTTLNFLGLPVRPGEKECAYYMTTGSCKYSTNCRFHHPDPTAESGQNPTGVQNGRSPRPYSYQANQNGGPHPSQPYPYQNGAPPQPYHQQAYGPPVPQGGGVQQPYALVGHHNGGPQQPYAPPAQMAMAPWPPQGNPNEAVAYANTAPPYAAPGTGCYIPPQQCIQASNAEWNGYQAPANQMHRGERNTRAAMMGSDVDGEYPERPGQPECQFFMKTGDCKFKAACRYHHPKSRQLKRTEFALSPLGLPLRSDQPICAYYKRNGTCKYGHNCRYHHPAELHSSAPSDAESLPSNYNQDFHTDQVQDSGW